MNPTMPCADLAPSAAGHFRLYFYAAVAHLLEHGAGMWGSRDALLAEFPFLAGYWQELVRQQLDRIDPPVADHWWQEVLAGWERPVEGHLPLRALREEAGLGPSGLLLLLLAGLIEEDARFGLLFERLHGIAGQHRPTLGLLMRLAPDALEGGGRRAVVQRLQLLGLLRTVNPEAPRHEWALEPPDLVWDALKGEPPLQPLAWLHYRSPGALANWADLVLPAGLQADLAAVPALLASGDARALIVRGPAQNGRRTALGAVARALGRGLLTVEGVDSAADERWRLVGPLATLLHAMPAVVLEPRPGETADLPRLLAYDGPVGVVMGVQGGLRGPLAEQALAVSVPIPDPPSRSALWARSLGRDAAEVLPELAGRFRITSGNIQRAATLARSYAALRGRASPHVGDIQEACRALNRHALDTLATRLPATGDWSQLAVAQETQQELWTLERRCRQREALHTQVGTTLGAQLNAGVRALFTGPSGTGKSFAARLLAASLQLDLYRLDLAAVVNKYIGETEKNLELVFRRAEELDVMLLVDEGDALLTQRTGVQTANDRYANLETNYLLQRLESFDGLVVITTNASQRIDEAFQRRIDVVVTFQPPDVPERWAIWQLHLPAWHAVEASFLGEVAQRCTLNGGQIRNAVLHASLLGLDDGGVIAATHLEAAVRREYRKAGAACPLRRATVADPSWR